LIEHMLDLIDTQQGQINDLLLRVDALENP